jgi:bacterioferritin-associated ferredoxin
MIVCICRGISDRDVVEAVRCGARTLEDVSLRCDGAGGDCGSCVAHIVRHLDAICERRPQAA